MPNNAHIPTPLSILPIGGVEEIGANAYLIGYGDHHLLIEAGIGFPGGDYHPGAERLIPNFGAIKDLGIEPSAALFTHGHEDHFGAVAELRQVFPNLPIHASAYSLELTKHRLRQGRLPQTGLFELPFEEVIQVGPFSIKLKGQLHSIPQAAGVIIECGDFFLTHSGDWKIERPGEVPELFSVPKPKDKLSLLMLESTNILSSNPAVSETDIQPHLEQIMQEHPGRLFATLFASNIERQHAMFRAAKKAGRSIVSVGKALQRHQQIAGELNPELPFDAQVSTKELAELPDSQQLILCTGCQAEAFGALARISRDDLPEIRMKPGDGLLYSAAVIPGNESSCYFLMNRMVSKGVKLYTSRPGRPLHGSGHAAAADLISAAQTRNPDMLIPIHGEPRQCAELLSELPEYADRSQLLSNGQQLLIHADGRCEREMKIEQALLYWVGGRGIAGDSSLFRERRRMAGYGVVLLQFAMLKGEEEHVSPCISTLGIFDNEIEKAGAEQAINDKLEDLFQSVAKDERLLTESRINAYKRLARTEIRRAAGVGRPILNILFPID